MRFLGLGLILLFIFTSCGMQHRLAKGDGEDSDSSYVYALPYPAGNSRLLIQGYNSWFSHKGRLGLDFKMKTGSPVLAARAGVVVSVQEGFKEGGVNRKYYRRSNSVVIRHEDGSQAFYGHLKYNGAAVSPGDTIQQGQLIAYSGSTGYSALPHLHFVVWGPTPKGRMQLPTRFQTRKGPRYLKPGKWYKAI